MFLWYLGDKLGVSVHFGGKSGTYLLFYLFVSVLILFLFLFLLFFLLFII